MCIRDRTKIEGAVEGAVVEPAGSAVKEVVEGAVETVEGAVEGVIVDPATPAVVDPVPAAGE